MATIRKRNTKWHVQVRRAGIPSQSRSFQSKASAQAWARQRETELDKGEYQTQSETLASTCVADLLERYLELVTPRKRGHASEMYRIKYFLRQAWSKTTLNKLSSKLFARYRDERLSQIKPSSVVREFGTLRSIFETAIREWDIPLQSNPIVGIRLPQANDARDRRLDDEELNAILTAAGACRSGDLEIVILVALETGLRRGELLSIRAQHIDFQNNTLLVPITKTGRPRVIPLTTRASELLMTAIENQRAKNASLFNCSPNALRLAWERCRARAACECPSVSEFRFHDLRHEAISRFFELGLTIPEVALISGHRDLRMLFRYTHLKPKTIAQKLNGEIPTCESL
jgi:integrase